MLQLPNNCTCSKPTIHSKKWTKPGASLKIEWRIQYYFRDPCHEYMMKRPQGKSVFVKGLNAFKTLTERREATRTLMENEMRLLQEEGISRLPARPTS